MFGVEDGVEPSVTVTLSNIEVLSVFAWTLHTTRPTSAPAAMLSVVEVPIGVQVVPSPAKAVTCLLYTSPSPRD